MHEVNSFFKSKITLVSRRGCSGVKKIFSSISCRDLELSMSLVSKTERVQVLGNSV